MRRRRCLLQRCATSESVVTYSRDIEDDMDGHTRPCPEGMIRSRVAPVRRFDASTEGRNVTVAEAADALGVSTQTIYNYIYAGKLRARRPTDRYVLDVAKLAVKRDRQR